jgi:nucleoside-diphosphate-sugar epimerase
MKILVTGYKGYIGGHLYKKLEKMGYEVYGIDLKDGEDVLDCLPSQNFDFVFHFAALPRVEYSVINPSYTLKQNVLVTSKLLEWSKNHGVKRFIFSSSSAVNGDGDGVPKSPYGLHKLMSEMECRLFSELYGLDTVCLRYFNAYSEDQGFGGSYSTAICAWMEMIRQGKPLRMDGDGEQTRDLVHVDDIVMANFRAMKSDKYFGGKTYNIGSGTSVSMNYIRSFIDLHHDVEWTSAPARKGDARHTLANISDAKIDFFYNPTISIEEGLTRCFSKENLK